MTDCQESAEAKKWTEVNLILYRVTIQAEKETYTDLAYQNSCNTCDNISDDSFSSKEPYMWW